MLVLRLRRSCSTFRHGDLCDCSDIKHREGLHYIPFYNIQLQVLIPEVPILSLLFTERFLFQHHCSTSPPSASRHYLAQLLRTIYKHDPLKASPLSPHRAPHLLCHLRSVSYTHLTLPTKRIV